MANNLFNYQTMAISVTNAYLTNDGVENSSDSWNITDYIPCYGATFTINPIGGIVPAICLYDADKNYITGKNYNTGGAITKASVTITSNTIAYFIRFSYATNIEYADNLAQIRVSKGSSATPYVPYTPSWYLDENDILTNENLPSPIDWQPPYPADMWALDSNDILTNSMLPEVLIDYQGAFNKCAHLVEVTIPKTVKSIGKWSFHETLLTSVTIASDCTYYDTSFPENCVINFYPD